MADKHDQSDPRRYRHIDPAILLQAIDGDPASFCALSRTFLDDAPPAFALLEQSLRQRAGGAIAHQSHALKSMTLLLGAQQLSGRLQEIESAALAGECDFAPVGTELAALFALVLQEVRASIAALEGACGARPAPH
jgi:HPt (histidine-containing phosphotransfer) domain-containing protein